MGRRQLDHGAFDHVVVADRFFGFRGEVFEGRGKIIAGSRSGSLGSGGRLGFDGGSGDRDFGRERNRDFGCGNVRSVRGGYLWLRGRRLYGLGSVYYGRSAVVCVVCSCRSEEHTSELQSLR